MSNASSDVKSRLPWKPWLGGGFAIFIFLASQAAAGLLVSIYPWLRGWSDARASDWFDNALAPRIWSFIIYAALIALAIRLFLRLYKVGPRVIGLAKPKIWDLMYSLAAFPVYLIVLLVTVAVVQLLAPGLDLNQRQELGFDGVYAGIDLVWIGLTLVILAPVVEEVIFRGFIYGSLRQGIGVVFAAIFTSLLFAAGHLAASSTGPLYIAAIDTFVLSLVLVYLREKTGSLWASIGLHVIKNSIAFVVVFVLGVS